MSFWFSTGTPTFLIELLQKSDFDIRKLDGIEAVAEQFDAPTNDINSPVPVLFQSGYLTIKAYEGTIFNEKRTVEGTILLSLQ